MPKRAAPHILRPVDHLLHPSILVVVVTVHRAVVEVATATAHQRLLATIQWPLEEVEVATATAHPLQHTMPTVAEVLQK